MWNFIFDLVEALLIGAPYIVGACFISCLWTWILTGWLGER